MGERVLSTDDHTLVMGVVNTTPDSFSDGGLHLDPGVAISVGERMIDEGVDIIDVGGESTRPGAAAVAAEEEMARVLPVVAALAARGAVVSIDTSKSAVARAALDAGAVIVNDVTALGDPEMAPLVAERGAGLVLMHMRGSPRTMQEDPVYDDVVAEVAAFLLDRVRHAVQAGVEERRICLDPGIGFGKTVGHNLDLIAEGVAVIAGSGHPVLVGASRKSFIPGVLGPTPIDARESATVAAHVLAIAAGATVVRTHNVVDGLRSARIADAIVRGVG